MKNTTIPSVTVRNLVLKTGDPKICVSISDRNQEEILDSARELVKRGADLAEWRADCFKGFINELLIEDTLSELREVLKDTPLIFTVRTLDEGGRADIKLFDYIKIYRAAARTDLVDIFDIEYKIMYQLPDEVINDIKKHGKIIVSKHDFNSTPEYDDLVDELIDRYGEPPESVIGLVEVSLLRNKAARLGISEITQRNGSMYFYTEYQHYMS